MNQDEIFKTGNSFLDEQGFDLSDKLEEVLLLDYEGKKKEMQSSAAIHYIHNISLFFALLKINNYYVHEIHSLSAAKQYIEFTRTLKPKFTNIMEALKDFRPEGLELDNNQD